MKQMAVNEDATFERMVVGSFNGIAHKAASEVVASPGRDYNPLFIIGDLGLGKTHLLHSIANRIRETDPDKKIVYVTVEKFANDLDTAMDQDSIEDFREYYRSTDVMLIDDIPFISGREETQEELFNNFNELFESGKQIVITSDRHPRSIPKLAKRLRSRFEGGVIVEIDPLDDDTKVGLIEKEAETSNLKIPEDMLDDVAKMIEGNIRDIQGIIRSLGIKYRTEGKAIDEGLVKKIISERTSTKEDQKLDKAMDDMKEGIKDPVQSKQDK